VIAANKLLLWFGSFELYWTLLFLFFFMLHKTGGFDKITLLFKERVLT